MVLTDKLLSIINIYDHIYFCTYYIRTNMPKPLVAQLYVPICCAIHYCFISLSLV